MDRTEQPQKTPKRPRSATTASISMPKRNVACEIAETRGGPTCNRARAHSGSRTPTMFGLGTPGIGSGRFTAGDRSLKQKESSRCLLPSPPEVPLLPSVISSGASTPSNLLTPGRLYEDDDGIFMVSSFVSDRTE